MMRNILKKRLIQYLGYILSFIILPLLSHLFTFFEKNRNVKFTIEKRQLTHIYTHFLKKKLC